jgi:hypothetical protein
MDKFAMRDAMLRRAFQLAYFVHGERELAVRIATAAMSKLRLNGALLEMVEKLCRRRTDFTPAYDCQRAARTTNAVDRLLDHLDRVLYSMRYCHGKKDSARLAVRAWAMQWNFHPYGSRLRHDQPSRSSPFSHSICCLYSYVWRSFIERLPCTCIETVFPGKGPAGFENYFFPASAMETHPGQNTYHISETK